MFPLGRNWIFSSWMATQRWKRRSHIFCDNLLFLFLVRNNNQDQTRRSFFSSCLLVFHFFDPPCGVGPLSVFVKKVYSLFILLFCFASSFSFNTKTRDQHIFWLIPETERRRHERPTLCDVSVCVWLLQCCCSYRSIAFKRGKKKGKWWKEETFLSPIFTRWFVSWWWWPSVAPATEKNVKSVNFFIRSPNKCPPFSWLTSGGGQATIPGFDKNTQDKIPFYYWTHHCLHYFDLSSLFFFFVGGPGWLGVQFERVGSIICCHPTPPCNCGNGSNNIGGGRRGGVDQGKKGGDIVVVGFLYSLKNRRSWMERGGVGLGYQLPRC